MPHKKKPAPISMKLAKLPTKQVVPPTSDVEPFNKVSSITAKQMARAERSIDNLREEVKGLRNRKLPRVAVGSPIVNIPARARIGKITIKYDQLGFPSELIPQYVEAVEA